MHTAIGLLAGQMIDIRFTVKLDLPHIDIMPRSSSSELDLDAVLVMFGNVLLADGQLPLRFGQQRGRTNRVAQACQFEPRLPMEHVQIQIVVLDRGAPPFGIEPSARRPMFSR